jgi:DNA-binding transcriptional MerR regulator
MRRFFQIGEVCHITGLTPRTLHYYDEIGLLVPSERLAGGQRLYTAADLDRIEQIKERRRLLGLSLSEIKRLLDAEDARRRHLARAREAPDEPGRRAALEQALAVTEAQWRSVQEKVSQLTRFEGKLERQVRELRRLLKPRRDRAAARVKIAPAASLPGGGAASALSLRRGPKTPAGSAAGALDGAGGGR